jgi:hypothetical protein
VSGGGRQWPGPPSGAEDDPRLHSAQSNRAAPRPRRTPAHGPGLPFTRLLMASMSWDAWLVERTPFPLPPDPSQVLTRTMTMLRLVRQGLRDMEEKEYERTLLGFFAVVVFGRAVTNAVQNLRTFDRQAFDKWYGPWKHEMEEDPLLRWFYKLRSDILKGIEPLIGFVIGSSGRGDLYEGAITVSDRPPPNIHRQQSIQDCTMINLCRLYVAYLEELVASAELVIAQVQDRYDMTVERDVPS